MNKIEGMENYIVSARKYRPQSFSTLIGQDGIATTLKNAIKRGKLAHAYLFCGPRGVGKTTSARIFAKIINCENPGENLEPCGECESCRSFAQGRSYCIHELDAASNNSVDDIRALTEKVQIPPQIGRYSVYIIDEVHMLSQQAFNAFLKTLEEPPEYAIFILATTEKHKILPTILSRCQTYDFNRIGVEDIVKNIRDIAQKEGVSIDEESMHVIAAKADGAMRDALTLFDQTVAFCGNSISYSQVIKNLNVLDYDYYFNIIRSSLSGKYTLSLTLFDEILSKGFNAQHFVGGLANHLRNLLVCKDTATVKLLEMAPAIAAKYLEQASVCSIKFLFDALAAATKCEIEYKNSPNQRLLVEFLLVKLASISAPLQEGTAPMAVPIAAAPVVAPEPAPEPVVEPARVVVQEPESVSEPAPVAEPESVVEPAPESVAELEPVAEAVSHSASVVGTSIRDLMNQRKQQEESQESVQTQPEVVEEKPQISMEQLNDAWKQMSAANEVSQFPNLVAAILATKPVLKEDGTTIVFPVTNIAQKSWIERKVLFTLEGILKRLLSTPDLKLLVEAVAPSEAAKPKAPYMPYEKDAHLQKNYPEYAELKRELELDLK